MASTAEALSTYIEMTNEKVDTVTKNENKVFTFSKNETNKKEEESKKLNRLEKLDLAFLIATLWFFCVMIDILMAKHGSITYGQYVISFCPFWTWLCNNIIFVIREYVNHPGLPTSVNMPVIRSFANHLKTNNVTGVTCLNVCANMTFICLFLWIPWQLAFGLNTIVFSNNNFEFYWSFWMPAFSIFWLVSFAITLMTEENNHQKNMILGAISFLNSCMFVFLISLLVTYFYVEPVEWFYMFLVVSQIIVFLFFLSQTLRTIFSRDITNAWLCWTTAVVMITVLTLLTAPSKHFGRMSTLTIPCIVWLFSLLFFA